MRAPQLTDQRLDLARGPMRTAPRPVRSIRQPGQAAVSIARHPRMDRLTRHAHLRGDLAHRNSIQNRQHRSIPLLDDRQRHQCQSRPPVPDPADGKSRSRPAASSINRDSPVKHLPRQDNRSLPPTGDTFSTTSRAARFARRRRRLAAASGRPRRRVRARGTPPGDGAPPHYDTRSILLAADARPPLPPLVRGLRPTRVAPSGLDAASPVYDGGTLSPTSFDLSGF